MNTCASCGALIQGRVYYRPIPSDLSALTDDPLDLPLRPNVDTICQSCHEGQLPWQTIHSAYEVDEWVLRDGSTELLRGMAEAQEHTLWREWARKMEVGKEYVVRLTRRTESVSAPGQPAYGRESRSILTLSYREHDAAAERRLAERRSERSGAAA